jgi:hypothetical protein
MDDHQFFWLNHKIEKRKKRKKEKKTWYCHTEKGSGVVSRLVVKISN